LYERERWGGSKEGGHQRWHERERKGNPGSSLGERKSVKLLIRRDRGG